MHPRNKYKTPVDFQKLAEAYEPLKEHIIRLPNSNYTTIDFQNDEAQRRLTEAICFTDFGVKLELPKDRLCPPVPNRMNYVLWIQDIVNAHADVLEVGARVVRGIDIGTGSSAIYPILATTLEPTWEMIATEIDDYSYSFAERNITANELTSRIHLKKATKDGLILFPLKKCNNQTFGFTMCNPPFYSSKEDVEHSADSKEFPPNSICTGAEVEMVFAPGGESKFVAQMVEESELFRTRCRWYTSMLGKMSSVSSVVNMLKNRFINNYAITQFVQGQTRRWAVAWSFTDAHLPDSIARIPNINSMHPLYSLLPPRNTVVQNFPRAKMQSLDELQKILLSVLSLIEAASATECRAQSGVVFESAPPLLVQATKNTWSRGSRRKKLAQSDNSKVSLPTELLSTLPTTHSTAISSEFHTGLVCSMQWKQPNSEGTDAGSKPIPNFVVQWIYGHDRPLFDSFVNHVMSKLRGALE